MSLTSRFVGFIIMLIGGAISATGIGALIGIPISIIGLCMLLPELVALILLIPIVAIIYFVLTN